MMQVFLPLQLFTLCLLTTRKLIGLYVTYQRLMRSIHLQQAVVTSNTFPRISTRQFKKHNDKKIHLRQMSKNVIKIVMH